VWFVCLAVYILNFSKAKLDVHDRGWNSIADIVGMGLVLSIQICRIGENRRIFMKGCVKKTAFLRQEDVQWIDDFLISAGLSDNFGMVVRNAVSEYVQKKKQARAAAYFKFIGEENCKALEAHAIKNGTDLEQVIKETLIQKSKYVSKLNGGGSNGN
jgi:hypothetical protein